MANAIMVSEGPGLCRNFNCRLEGRDGDSAKPRRRCARQDPLHPCRAGVHPDMAGGLIATRPPHPPQHQSGMARIVPLYYMVKIADALTRSTRAA